MRIFIQHTTTLTYDAPISEAHTEVRQRPLDAGGQRCLSFRLEVRPERANVLSFVDHFDNVVHYFDWLQPHDQVVITANSEVLTPAVFRDDHTDLSPLERFDYLAPTTYAPRDEMICAFSAPHIARSPYDTALALMEAIYHDIQYERGATHVKTTADEVIQLRRGVCQDFAHLFIAACRCQGIPARYVSGYLYDPKFFGVEVATHAWADVFIEGQGWVSLDPTHNCPQDERYVRVAVGRDYADTPPTRGVFKGNARETLNVRVTIRSA